MIKWGKIKTIQREVAEMPVKWLYQFAAAHPWAIRKVSAATNSPLLFNSVEVLKAVAAGWNCEVGGVDEAEAAAVPTDADRDIALDALQAEAMRAGD